MEQKYLDSLHACKEILNNFSYVTLSTADGELPWGTPVYAVCDNELNFYWASWTKAQHSLNIAKNQNVFISIFDTNNIRGQNNMKGVYIKAEAEMIDSSDDLEEVFEIFKPNGGGKYENADFLGDSPRRVYKAKTHQAWVNVLSESEVGAETVKMRQEVDLAELKLMW